MLSFIKSLRLPQTPRAAFVGAGGKTTAIFTLARQVASPVLVTATTHMGKWELKLADKIIILPDGDVSGIHDNQISEGVTIIIGPLGEKNRHNGLDEKQILALAERADRENIPLFIEADGSRKRPLKAPAEYEPVIPGFVNVVVVVAGMSALLKPLSPENVHRVESFSYLGGIKTGETITPEAIVRVLRHPYGGLKGIPKYAKKILLLNQVESFYQNDSAQYMAPILLSDYERVIIGSLNPMGNPDRDMSHLETDRPIDLELPSGDLLNHERILSVHERIVGVVLAAGESRRFGRPKQLVDWNGEPLIRHVVKRAVNTNLYKVFVITGAYHKDITITFGDLPVINIYNPGWQEGQSSSIRLALKHLKEDISGVMFILADQPYISNDLIYKLIDTHSLTLSPILAPIVENQRGNPVLFDRITFSALVTLSGNQGGRYIFDRFPIQYVKWDDPKIFVDIDTQKDYQDLEQDR